MYAHTQTILPRDWGRRTVQRSSHCHFHCARKFATPVLAHMLNSLVRVSRRGKENHFAHTQPAQPRYKAQLILVQDLLAEPAKVDHIGPQRPNRKRVGKYDTNQSHWFPSLPFQQFQVLLNSLFKVLCIFPSRYLYAIGLPPIFSFRWNLPPTLSCNPKQLDSLIQASKTKQTGVSPSLLPFSKRLDPAHNASISKSQFSAERRFTYWAIPTSVALTRGILVSVFSSA